MAFKAFRTLFKKNCSEAGAAGLSEQVVATPSYDLRRFVSAQESTYDDAINELMKGKKLSHWMWFVFPQLDGLGYSPMAKHYSIKTIEEAQAYLNHNILGQRLKKCCEILLTLPVNDPLSIFGNPDNLKLKSSMTLFLNISEDKEIFCKVLNKFFDNEQDTKTLSLIDKLKNIPSH